MHFFLISDGAFSFLFVSRSLKRRPPGADGSFYLRPRKKPSEAGIWFDNMVVGKHTLSEVVKTVATRAGLAGKKFTNHSLRKSSASVLYQSGMDEQLVQEQTGHRSVEALRIYKKSTSAQKRDVSDTLNPMMRDVVKKNKMEEKENVSVADIASTVASAVASVMFSKLDSASPSVSHASAGYYNGFHAPNSNMALPTHYNNQYSYMGPPPSNYNHQYSNMAPVPTPSNINHQYGNMVPVPPQSSYYMLPQHIYVPHVHNVKLNSNYNNNAHQSYL